MVDQKLWAAMPTLVATALLGAVLGFAGHWVEAPMVVALLAMGTCTSAFFSLLAGFMTADPGFPTWRLRLAALGAGLTLSVAVAGG